MGSTDLTQEAVGQEEAFQGTLQLSRAWEVVRESARLTLKTANHLYHCALLAIGGEGNFHSA